MNKFLFLFFISINITLFADQYDDALKFEAIGDIEKFSNSVNNYFKANINNKNQDNIVDKLLYSSTLFSSISESIEFLEYYVKYIENRNSRFTVYRKIAEIYELSGRIRKAGIYYEKAAFIDLERVHLPSLLDCVEMLIEIGDYEASLKITKKYYNLLNSEYKNRTNSILCRTYFLIDDVEKALFHLNRIDLNYRLYTYLFFEVKKEFKFESKKGINSIIADNPYLKLRTPSDYTYRTSSIKNISAKKTGKINKEEILVNKYTNKNDASGTINILEQLKLEWYLDKTDINCYYLYIFSEDKFKTITQLNKLGIIIKE